MNIGVSLAQADPHRQFALTLIKVAVGDVRRYIHRHAADGRVQATGAELRALMQRRMRRGINAWLWLNGHDGLARITLKEICDGLGIDLAWMRESIFEQFRGKDRVQLDALKSLALRFSRSERKRLQDAATARMPSVQG